MNELPVAIIGLGLVGGSLGLALGTADYKALSVPKPRIIGYDADRSVVRTARGRLAIDQEAGSLEEAVREAAVVIIATPVQQVADVMRQIAPHLRHGSLVIDTSSTKATVMEWARQHLPTTTSFVGGHPMAGSERAGIDSASIDLFRGAIFCLCPDQNAKPNAVDLAQTLVELIGAKPYYMDPVEHDAFVAGISHLPFILSTALVEATTRSASWFEMRNVAASGYRDVSRLASGDPTMHRDICLTNGPAITRWINESIRLLVEFREAIEAGDAAALDALFTHAKQERDAWLEHIPNQRPGERAETAERDEYHGPFLSLFSGGFSSRRKNKNRK